MTLDQENKLFYACLISIPTLLVSLIIAGGVGSSGHSFPSNNILPKGVTQLSGDAYLVEKDVSRNFDPCQGEDVLESGTVSGLGFYEQCDGDITWATHIVKHKHYPPVPNFIGAILNISSESNI